MTDRLGDMLKEMRDPNLDAAREAEIVRLLNEESDRLDIYKGWVGADKSVVTFNTLRAFQPFFTNSPLYAGHLSTSGVIPNTTNSYLTWAQSVGNRSLPNNIFDVGNSDTAVKFTLGLADRILLLLGSFSLTVSAGGAFSLFGEQYDINNVSVGDFVVGGMVISASDYLTFISTLQVSNQCQSIKIYGYQTTGSDVTISGHMTGILIL